MPALAVADALRAEGVDVVWVGGERAETRLVPEAGYELRTIRVEGLSRTKPLKAARALVRAARAVIASRRLLAEVRPDAVLGGGGYVAGPVGVAAVLRRVPLVLTEADSHLGLANRLLARFAARVCLAFALPGRDSPRYLVTGRPVPPPFGDRSAARRSFGVAGDERYLLIVGGSLGARSLNLVAPEAFAVAPPRVLHITGERDAAVVVAPGPHYELREWVAPLGPALAACDLVVARSGGSVFELAAHGVPAVLVPYPHATGGHQERNARWMADAGAAVVIADAELTPARLRSEVDALLDDPARLAAMARASAGLARLDAASAVAAEVVAAAGGGG